MVHSGSKTSGPTSLDVTSTACDAEVLIAASQLGPSFGSLDTGATKTAIGSQLVMPLTRSLAPAIQRKVRKVPRCPCQVVFKFGNLSTLESSQALVIPIGKLDLKVAVVPGCTPCLLSNTFMRALKALIDTANHKLLSPCLRKELSLHLTPKGLLGRYQSTGHSGRSREGHWGSRNIHAGRRRNTNRVQNKWACYRQGRRRSTEVKWWQEVILCDCDNFL